MDRDKTKSHKRPRVRSAAGFVCFDAQSDDSYHGIITQPESAHARLGGDELLALSDISATVAAGPFSRLTAS